MDGSVFRLTGADGIRINDHQAPFLQLAKDANWYIDFVTSTFSLECLSVRMNMRIMKQNLSGGSLTKRRRMSSGMKAMSSSKGLLDLERSSALSSRGMDAPGDSSSSSSPPWSFTAQDNVSVLMKGRTDEWIKGHVRSMTFALSSDPSSDCILSEFEMAGAQLGPTSFGDATILVPATILNSETTLLSVKAPVQVHFDSVSSIEKIQASCQEHSISISVLR
jgi:hypothetical protein